MAERELDLTLTPQAATLEAWEALARKALGGHQPADLATLTEDGISIGPLGTRRDWPQPDASGFPGSAPYTRGAHAQSNGRWDIRTIIAEPDAARANAQMLEDLANGATSLWLRLDRGARSGQSSDGEDGLCIRTANDLKRTFEGIPDRTAIALDAGAAALPLARLMGTNAQRFALFFQNDVFATVAAYGRVPGSIEQEIREAATLAQLPGTAEARAVGIDSRPYHNAGATPAQELAIAVASAVAYLRALTEAGLSIDVAAKQVAFIQVTDADFFVSIAKLRALRRIWARILEACGAPDAMAAFHLSAVTSELMMTRRSAHTNILRTTVATFAAALGGADAIIVTPFTSRLGSASATARRIARNTQAVLLEEAQLARVLDPFGGAFAIERFTEDLASTAWARFQEIERRGGMAAALTNGFFRDRINTAWEARRKRIAERRELITGVSDFPMLDEAAMSTAPNAKPDPSEIGGDITLVADAVKVMKPLPTHYLDEDFERLRAASDAHLAQAGERPKIALICIGSEADFGSREGFARTLFESGGIAAVSQVATDAETAAAAFLDSGIRIAALVSSDAVYAERALAFAHEIKRAGARYLYFVGAPGELEVPLLEAGMDAFVAGKFDAIELLRRAHTVLGLGV